MISVVVIYNENDSKFIQGLLQSINFECEIILAKTIPAGAFFSRVANEEGNIKFVEIEYPYGNFSFSRMRNIAKQFAKYDYCVWLDADERISLDVFELEQIIKNDIDIVYAKVISPIKTVDGGDFDMIEANRVVIYKKKYDFKYSVHEKLNYPDNAKKYFARIFIRHLGYWENTNSLAKAERNIDLMIKDLYDEHRGDEIVMAQLYKTLDLRYELLRAKNGNVNAS
jgi:hypothetical protein